MRTRGALCAGCWAMGGAGQRRRRLRAPPKSRGRSGRGGRRRCVAVTAKAEAEAMWRRRRWQGGSVRLGRVHHGSSRRRGEGDGDGDGGDGGGVDGAAARCGGGCARCRSMRRRRRRRWRRWLLSWLCCGRAGCTRGLRWLCHAALVGLSLVDVGVDGMLFVLLCCGWRWVPTGRGARSGACCFDPSRSVGRLRRRLLLAGCCLAVVDS